MSYLSYLAAPPAPSPRSRASKSQECVKRSACARLRSGYDEARAGSRPGQGAAGLTLTGAVPGTYPRPQSRYLYTCHSKPILKLHHWSTRLTCGPRAGAAGLTLTGAAPGTYPRPRSTHIGRAHTRRGQCLVHTHGPSHEQSDAYSKHDPEPDRPTGCGPVKW